MARITVEDCIDKFTSRFELVLVASNRARKLYSGENPTVEIDNDKNTVIALREIAEETISKEKLKDDLISEYQSNTFSEDEEINEIEDSSDESETEANELEVDKSDESETEANELEVDKIEQNNEDANNSTEDTLIETEQNNIEDSSDDENTQDL